MVVATAMSRTLLQLLGRMAPASTLAQCISAVILVFGGGGAVWALPEGMVVTGGQLGVCGKTA